MKLYDRFAAKGFHSSFITTFGIDFDTYENVCLNRLRGAGCTNNFILPDARLLTHALSGASALPRYAGRLYAASGMNAPQGGVFHSKLFLRLGRRSGELLVGSANMTSPGLAGNRELMGMIECGPEESEERALIAAAWSYIDARLDQTQGAIAQQIAWMLARTPWLADTEPAQGLTVLRDNSQAAFLANGDGRPGIGGQFIDLIDERPVQRLIVISPYWDQSLAALKYLIAELAPQETMLLIAPKSRLFPVGALEELSGVRLADISVLDPLRFFHAKAIIAQAGQADHVLFGSANCTAPALGTPSSSPINEEACLYRRLPPQAAIAALGIEKLLSGEHAIERSTLPSPKIEDDLDLPGLSRLSPGRFECDRDTLTWWPPQRPDAGSAAIELMDADGAPFPATLVPLHAQMAARRFRVAGAKDRPALARLKYPDGTFSAPAIITIADALKQTAKEARSRKVDDALALLADETTEDIALLEVIDLIAAAEEKQAEDAKAILRKRRARDKPEPPPEQHRTMDYESFIAGREQRAGQSALPASSFSGSDLSLVRGFLNRILGLGGSDEPALDIAPDEDMAGAFDMGDETADAQGAIEEGDEFNKTASKKKAENCEDEEKKKERLRRERRKAQADQILDAIESFNERIDTRAAAGELGTIDTLRLRALISVTAMAGHNGAPARPQNATLMQVFPAAGDANSSWPRLLGRILFIFFGGSKPAISALRLDSSFDELTADIKESWAACFWAIQACLQAARKHRSNASLIKSMETLSTRLYAVTGLKQVELTGPDITAVIAAMNERYARRLGVDAAAIESAHRAAAAQIAAAS